MKEYHTTNKDDWGVGPWTNEPDFVVWTDAATGYRCLMRRGPAGAWCGYVQVPESHPLYGVPYYRPTRWLERLLRARLEQPVGERLGLAVMIAYLTGNAVASPGIVFTVHGGITFSGPRETEPNGKEEGWWFGFDCAHAGDFSPKIQALLGRAGDWPGEEYRDRAYVQSEVERLALQLFLVDWPWYVGLIVRPWRRLKVRIYQTSAWQRMCSRIRIFRLRYYTWRLDRCLRRHAKKRHGEQARISG